MLAVILGERDTSFLLYIGTFVSHCTIYLSTIKHNIHLKYLDIIFHFPVFPHPYLYPISIIVVFNPKLKLTYYFKCILLESFCIYFLDNTTSNDT